MKLKVISLGAGVQSSAMLLMALDGAFGDVPDCAIFSDTQDEPSYVYEWLDRLESIVAPFRIYRVTAGRLSENVLAGGRGWLPTYALNKEGKIAMLKRQCSAEFKIIPIRQKIRQLAGKRGMAECWIGISTDEAHRMKPTGRKWVVNRFPLIEQNLKRIDCAEYLKSRGFPAVKSACVFCPLKSDRDWVAMKRNAPKDFADACAFDNALRGASIGFRGEQFLHKKLLPLRDVNFAHEHQFDIDGFGNECEGMCGI